MFGVGIPELLVIVAVAVFLFGPDKAPDFARQLARVVRELRQLSHRARDELRSELGPEYADLELTDLDPRRAIRKHLTEAWNEAPEQSMDGERPAS